MAGTAKVTASGVEGGYSVDGATDGVVGGYPGDKSQEWSAGSTVGATLTLTWATPQTIDHILLYDRPNLTDQITSGLITFSDGTTLPVGALPNDAKTPFDLRFPAKTVTVADLQSHRRQTGDPERGPRRDRRLPGKGIVGAPLAAPSFPESALFAPPPEKESLMRLLLALLALLSLFASATAAPDATPHVAVFTQPGFVPYGTPASLSPKKIAADLRAVGLAADQLDAAALSDPARMNATAYAAVVLPYGNAYPQAAFANLKAFHQAGGCLVLSGIPFTHASAPDARGTGRTWAMTVPRPCSGRKVSGWGASRAARLGLPSSPQTTRWG